MNRFDGKSYWIDEPLAFQSTSVRDIPRKSISYYDEILKEVCIKTFPTSIVHQIGELYMSHNQQGKFKITKTGTGINRKYNVTYLNNTIDMNNNDNNNNLKPIRNVTNPIMELNVNE